MFTYEGLKTQLSNFSDAVKGITGTTFNATISFEEGDGNLIEDPITGNWITSAPLLIELQAKLIQRKDPNLIQNAGIEQINTYLEGWLTCPEEYNGAIPKTVDCQLLQNNRWVQGKLTIIDNIPTEFLEKIDLSIGIGQKICGYFSRLDSESF